MSSALEHESSMVNALRVTDPTLNTSLGTPIRKMLSAVASELARLSQDQVQTTSLYSLDALSGSDLDALVAQFGFTRQVARAARGYVKITRDNGDSVWAVPYGTQFWRPATSSTAAIGFSTMAYAEMAEGVLSCEVSVCAVQAGSSGNVPADTVTLSSSTGYVSVTNPEPTAGGRDAETDAQLRQRFLETVFRNEAGTRDQLLGLARAHAEVSRALSVGQSSRYVETVQVVRPKMGDGVHFDLKKAPVADVSAEHFTHEVKGPWNGFSGTHVGLVDPSRRHWVTLSDTSAPVARGRYDVTSCTWESKDGKEYELDGARVEFKPLWAEETIGPFRASTDGDARTYSMSHGSIRRVKSVTAVTPGSDDVEMSLEEVVKEVGEDEKAIVGMEARFEGVTYLTIDYESGVATAGKVTTAAIGSTTSFRVSYEHEQVADGQFVTVEFDYRSTLSRSDRNDVELYVDGLLPTKVSDIAYLRFANEVTASNRSRWRREDGSMPAVGSLYVPLSYQPMSSSAGYVNVGTSQILVEHRDFEMIHDAGSCMRSPLGCDAVEILGEKVSQNGADVFHVGDKAEPTAKLTDETPMNIPYYYNGVPGAVQDLVSAQSVVTQDVCVHEVSRRHIGIYLTVMYSTFPRETIAKRVEDAVVSWAGSLPIGSQFQFSDVETVAANLSGVDNVRVSTEADAQGAVLESVTAADDVGVYKKGDHPGAFGVVEVERDGKTLRAQFTKDFSVYADEVLDVQFVKVYSTAQKGFTDAWGR